MSNCAHREVSAKRYGEHMTLFRHGDIIMRIYDEDLRSRLFQVTPDDMRRKAHRLAALAEAGRWEVQE